MGGLACLPYFEQQQPSFHIILRLVNPVLSSSSASSSSSAITTLSRILPGFWPNRNSQTVNQKQRYHADPSFFNSPFSTKATRCLAFALSDTIESSVYGGLMTTSSSRITILFPSHTASYVFDKASVGGSLNAI